MTKEQTKALQVFSNNFVVNITHAAEHGAMTFEQAVRLLQNDLAGIERDPVGYCKYMGFWSEE